MLFELLTGVRPHAGRGASDLMYQVLHEAPRRATQFDPRLPEALDAVFARLAKRPVDRFPGDRQAIGCRRFAGYRGPGRHPHRQARPGRWPTVDESVRGLPAADRHVLGRLAYLAGLPTAAREEALQKLKYQVTGKWTALRAAVEAAAANLATNGFVFNEGFYHPDVNAVGSPAFDKSGKPQYVVTCGGPNLKAKFMRDEIGPRLARLSRKITVVLGFTGHSDRLSAASAARFCTCCANLLSAKLHLCLGFAQECVRST